MIDMLCPYLQFDQDDPAVMEDVEKCIKKIDKLLLENGWEYTGFRNMYRPVKDTENDETWHKAKKAVLKDDELKKYKPYFTFGVMTSHCGLSEVVIKGMSPVGGNKLKTYEEYYDGKKRFAHGIVVDENNILRDGYATYLIAKEKNAAPEIMCARSTQPVRKIVHGIHVRKTEDGYEDKSDRIYVWYYDLKEAVVPGDILRVRTRFGKDLIRVCKVSYVAGVYSCRGRHKNVCCHTGDRWEA